MRNKIIVFGLLVALSVVAVFAYQTKPTSQQSALRDPSENTAGKLPPTLGTPSAVPNIIAVNTPTPVVITVRADPPLIPSSVDLLRVNSDGSSIIVGRLNDEGKNGDVKAGDKVFTTTLLMNESTPGVVSFQASAAYHGFRQRILSAVTSIQIWNHFVDASLGIVLSYPAELRAQSLDSNTLLLTNTPSVGPISDENLQNQLAFQIRRLSDANAGALPIHDWFQQTVSANLPEAPLSEESVTISGKSAIEIATSEIGSRVHDYVDVAPDVYEITYGTYNSQSSVLYKEIVKTLTFSR